MLQSKVKEPTQNFPILFKTIDMTIQKNGHLNIRINISPMETFKISREVVRKMV